MRSLLPRWRAVVEYMRVLLSPLQDAGATDRWILVEACGPDGRKPWTTIHPVAVPLTEADPALVAARVMATLCGATQADPDPGPEGQRGLGLYYVASSLVAARRTDANVAALGAIVLDLDDRSLGGRAGVEVSLGRLPAPTAVIHSGGGKQVAYVLREAIDFDRADELELERRVRRYIRVATSLQTISGADETAWPSHLFRCPGTYHLKDPGRPVLVGVDVEPTRRFNLDDFESFAAAADDVRVERLTSRTVARLLGRAQKAPSLEQLAPLATRPGADGTPRRYLLPRRVSSETVRLLNRAEHARYSRPDGSLDRSRAVYAAALSLLGAGLPEERVAAVIAASSLRPALDDRGDDAMRWLSFQIAAAREYLAKAPSRKRGSK